MTNEEPKSAQPAPNLNSILEAGTEGLETLALSGLGLGFRAAIPKMPSFRVSYLVLYVYILLLLLTKI